MSADDDGFITATKMPPGGRGRGPNRTTVTFGKQTAMALDLAPDATHMDWQWDGNGMARLRFHNEGVFKVTRPKAAVTAVQVNARPLYRLVGRSLRGRYPITRIDGHDLYIDINETAEAVQ